MGAGETAAMDLTSRAFEVDGAEFRVNFTQQDAFVWAALVSSDPKYLIMAHVLTIAWARNPVELLHGLQSGAFLETGGFNTIEYEDDLVNLDADGEELQVPRGFFREVAMEFAACHLEVVGPAYFPWWAELNAELADELV